MKFHDCLAIFELSSFRQFLIKVKYTSQFCSFILFRFISIFGSGSHCSIEQKLSEFR